MIFLFKIEGKKPRAIFSWPKIVFGMIFLVRKNQTKTLGTQLFKEYNFRPQLSSSYLTSIGFFCRAALQNPSCTQQLLLLTFSPLSPQ